MRRWEASIRPIKFTLVPLIGIYLSVGMVYFDSSLELLFQCKSSWFICQFKNLKVSYCSAGDNLIVQFLSCTVVCGDLILFEASEARFFNIRI